MEIVHNETLIDVRFRFTATYRADTREDIGLVAYALGAELIEQDGVEQVSVSFAVPGSDPEVWAEAAEWDKRLAGDANDGEAVPLC